MQTIVCPVTGSQVPPLRQEKMTPPQSNPEGQSSSFWQIIPQNEPVCPSVTKDRQRAELAAPQVCIDTPPHVLQSTRPVRVRHWPFVLSQNLLTGQPWLSRQNGWHWPFTHASRAAAVTIPVGSAQSPSVRQPMRQVSVWLLQMVLGAQCSSSVHGPSGMHRVVEVSQNVPEGQSRLEVHVANDWQKPSGLQKFPLGQPALLAQRQPPDARSQSWFAGHDALLMHTHRSEPSVALRKPGGQHMSPVHTQAPTDGL